MQFSKITLLSLLGLGLASPLEQQKRTVGDIVAVIDILSTELTAFDVAIKAFGDSVTIDQAQGMLSAYVSLQASLTKATSDCKSVGHLSASDSETIESAVEDLTTKVSDTLTDALHKKSSVESSGYISELCDGLSTFNDGSDGFYQALLINIDSDHSDHLTKLQVSADKSFTSTMDSYGC